MPSGFKKGSWCLCFSVMKELPCIASIDEIELKDEPINGYEDFEIIN